MLSSRRSFPRRALALLPLPLLATACVDGSPLLPGTQMPPTVAIPALQCQVDVQAETLTCTRPDPVLTQHAIAANRIIGGQDVNVKLSGSNVSYDAGTEIFSIDVTVQNLLQAALGTVDGNTVNGVDIFFSQEPIAQPSGTVTIANATGEAFFTDPDQPYYHYAQILQPYEISNPLTWLFNTPTTVTSFSFIVYVSAPQVDEMLPLLDRVWTGSTSDAWTLPGNWRDGLTADSASAVSVPTDSLMVGTFSPVLSADAELTHLRVGGGNTFNLGGFTLTAWGNVDAPGTISNGVLRLGGPTALLRGQVPSLLVNSGARLQGSTVASGAVSISDGSLVVSGNAPLSVSIP